MNKDFEDGFGCLCVEGRGVGNGREEREGEVMRGVGQKERDGEGGAMKRGERREEREKGGGERGRKDG